MQQPHAQTYKTLDEKETDSQKGHAKKIHPHKKDEFPEWKGYGRIQG